LKPCTCIKCMYGPFELKTVSPKEEEEEKKDEKKEEESGKFVLVKLV
jgi:hypothetical protein